MISPEYDIMAAAEERHWWYVHLRQILFLFWGRHARKDAALLLDCGCGTGGNLAALSNLSANSLGFDYSPHAIAYCRRRGLRGTAIGDTTFIPFENTCADVALSCDILGVGGVPSPLLALQEIQRVLKPGGVLFLNLPANPWLMSSHDTAVDNVRRFTRAQVKRLLQEAGLEVVELSYWNTLLFPGLALLRIFRKSGSRKTSDLTDGQTGAIAFIAKWALAFELSLMRRCSLPFGLSIFAVARKPAHAPEGSGKNSGPNNE